MVGAQIVARSSVRSPHCCLVVDMFTCCVSMMGLECCRESVMTPRESALGNCITPKVTEISVNILAHLLPGLSILQEAGAEQADRIRVLSWHSGAGLPS